MTNIAPINSKNLPVLSKSMGDQQLGTTDFLRLMTTQLKQQDPFSPMDNQAMVAQMAQFSSVAGIEEMNVSLKSIAEQINKQTEILARMQASPTLSVERN